MHGITLEIAILKERAEFTHALQGRTWICKTPENPSGGKCSHILRNQQFGGMYLGIKTFRNAFG